MDLSGKRTTVEEQEVVSRPAMLDPVRDVEPGGMRQAKLRRLLARRSGWWVQISS